MATKITTRSPEQRLAEVEALHASVVEQVRQLADRGQWRAFLRFARSFHHYSLSNVLLILAQNPNATMVAGFRQWQAKGRQVRKGEGAIKIFGFREKVTHDDEDEAAENEGRVRRYFPTLSVFDIAQTDPVEGAEPVPEDPTKWLTGNDDHGIIESLTAHLNAVGWTIHRAPLASASGYTDPELHRVTLAENLGGEQSAKTLIHEAAHIELHHTNNIGEYRAHRDRMEVEAESVAYIVAGLVGFDTSAYSIGYINGWADEDIRVIRDTAARVLAVACALADAIDH